MNITDLAETNVNFTLDFSGDGVEYWDYTFYAKVHDEREYMQTMNRCDIEQLRDNCKKILNLTNWLD